MKLNPQDHPPGTRILYRAAPPPAEEHGWDVFERERFPTEPLPPSEAIVEEYARAPLVKLRVLTGPDRRQHYYHWVPHGTVEGADRYELLEVLPIRANQH